MGIDPVAARLAPVVRVGCRGAERSLAWPVDSLRAQAAWAMRHTARDMGWMLTSLRELVLRRRERRGRRRVAGSHAVEYAAPQARRCTPCGSRNEELGGSPSSTERMCRSDVERGVHVWAGRNEASLCAH